MAAGGPEASGTSMRAGPAQHGTWLGWGPKEGVKGFVPMLVTHEETQAFSPTVWRAGHWRIQTLLDMPLTLRYSGGALSFFMRTGPSRVVVRWRGGGQWSWGPLPS